VAAAANGVAVVKRRIASISSLGCSCSEPAMMTAPLTHGIGRAEKDRAPRCAPGPWAGRSSVPGREAGIGPSEGLPVPNFAPGEHGRCLPVDGGVRSGSWALPAVPATSAEVTWLAEGVNQLPFPRAGI